MLAPPVAVNRTLAIERLDYNTPDGKDRVMGRVLINLPGRAGFHLEPLQGLSSRPLHENTVARRRAVTSTPSRPNLTNEARLSYSTMIWAGTARIPRSRRSTTDDPYFVNGVAYSGVTLPGSPAFYAYKNVNNSWEALDNVIWTHGQHLVTVGGGVLLRSSNGYLTAGRTASICSPTSSISLSANPAIFGAAIDRTALPIYSATRFQPHLQIRQYFLFAQDTYKLTCG